MEYDNNLKPKPQQPQQPQQEPKPQQVDIGEFIKSQYSKLMDVISNAPIPKNTEAGPVQYEIAQAKLLKQMADMLGIDLKNK